LHRFARQPMQSSELILLRTYCAPVPHRELLQNELEDFVRQPDEGVSAAASRLRQGTYHLGAQAGSVPRHAGKGSDEREES